MKLPIPADAIDDIANGHFLDLDSVELDMKLAFTFNNIRMELRIVDSEKALFALCKHTATADGWNLKHQHFTVTRSAKRLRFEWLGVRSVRDVDVDILVAADVLGGLANKWLDMVLAFARTQGLTPFEQEELV